MTSPEPRPGFEVGDVRAAYDVVADEYELAFGDELSQKPLDRADLDELAKRTTGQGLVLDLGCGPGHVGGYLVGRGVSVVGVDLSVGMLRVAQRRNPASPVVASDVRQLPFAGESCAGAIAFYSLHHLPRSSLPPALGELFRVLVPGAPVLIATHVGQGEVYVNDWLGHPVTLGGTLYDDPQLCDALTGAGLIVENIVHRELLDPERGAERLYVTARKGQRGEETE